MSILYEETGPLQMLATVQHLCGVRLLIVWYRGKKKYNKIKKNWRRFFISVSLRSFFLRSSFTPCTYCIPHSFSLSLF